MKDDESDRLFQHPVKSTASQNTTRSPAGSLVLEENRDVEPFCEAIMHAP